LHINPRIGGEKPATLPEERLGLTSSRLGSAEPMRGGSRNRGYEMHDIHPGRSFVVIIDGRAPLRPEQHRSRRRPRAVNDQQLAS